MCRGSRSPFVPMEELPVFLEFVAFADWAWERVSSWEALARDTVGKQLVRAADSVGANLVEGDGRFSKADGLHFFVIARASAREARYWLERARRRGLLNAAESEEWNVVLSQAVRQLNALIAYRRAQQNQVREPVELYATSPSTLNTQHYG